MVHEVPKARFDSGHLGVGLLSGPDEVSEVDSMYPGIRHGTIMCPAEPMGCSPEAIGGDELSWSDGEGAAIVGSGPDEWLRCGWV